MRVDGIKGLANRFTEKVNGHPAREFQCALELCRLGKKTDTLNLRKHPATGVADMRHMISLLHLPAAILATAVLWTSPSSAGAAQTATIAPPVGALGSASSDTLAATKPNSASAPISDRLIDRESGQSLNAHLHQRPGKSTLNTGKWLYLCGAADGCP